MVAKLVTRDVTVKRNLEEKSEIGHFSEKDQPTLEGRQ
jgi:hypothetical protein